MLNAPLSSLVPEAVVGPLTVIVAPASAAPLAVVTVPEIVPVVACATIGAGSEAAITGPTVVAAIAKLAAATIMRRHNDVWIKGSPKNEKHSGNVPGLMA